MHPIDSPEDSASDPPSAPRVSPRVARPWTSAALLVLAVVQIVSLLAGLQASNGHGFAAPLGVAWAVTLGGAVLVGADASKIGVKSLKLSRVSLTSWERMTPVEWGVLAALFSTPTLFLYAAKRRRLAALVGEAKEAGAYEDAADRKRSEAAALPDVKAKRASRMRKDVTLWSLTLLVVAVIALPAAFDAAEIPRSNAAFMNAMVKAQSTYLDATKEFATHVVAWARGEEATEVALDAAARERGRVASERMVVTSLDVPSGAEEVRASALAALDAYLAAMDGTIACIAARDRICPEDPAAWQAAVEANEAFNSVVAAWLGEASS